MADRQSPLTFTTVARPPLRAFPMTARKPPRAFTATARRVSDSVNGPGGAQDDTFRYRCPPVTSGVDNCCPPDPAGVHGDCPQTTAGVHGDCPPGIRQRKWPGWRTGRYFSIWLPVSHLGRARLLPASCPPDPAGVHGGRCPQKLAGVHCWRSTAPIAFKFSGELAPDVFRPPAKFGVYGLSDGGENQETRSPRAEQEPVQMSRSWPIGHHG